MANFILLTKNEEINLLQTDTAEFLQTKSYLLPLITSAVEQKIKTRILQEKIKNEILSDVPLAARRFLQNTASEKSFASYFTWYIAQKINTDETQLAIASPIKKIFYKIKIAIKRIF